MIQHSTHRNDATTTAGTRGFTLLEMIAVLVILGVVGAVAAQPLARAMEAVTTARTLTDAEGDLAAALDRMTRDIREGTVDDCQQTRLVVDRDDNTLTFEIDGDFLRLEGAVLAGTRDDPISAPSSDDTALCYDYASEIGNWNAERFYRLHLSTESGYKGETHVYQRKED